MGNANINSYLEKIYSDRCDMEKKCALLKEYGIAAESLPSDNDLHAFVLLQDHERESVEGELRFEWKSLISKGCVKEKLEAVSTPLLRLLVHTKPFIKQLPKAEERLANSKSAAMPSDILSTHKEIYGIWGQECSLDFVANKTRCMLIRFDPIFNLESKFLQADVTNTIYISFQFPIDNGAINIRIQSDTGEIYQHIINVKEKGEFLYAY